MKKLFAVAIIVGMALAACGKKNDGATTTPPATGSGDAGSAAGSGDMGSAAGSGDAPADPAAGGGSAM